MDISLCTTNKILPPKHHCALNVSSVAAKPLGTDSTLVYKLIHKRRLCGPRVSTYDVSVSIVGNGGSAEETAITAAPDGYLQARRLFGLLVKHRVTPCTLKDVVEDFMRHPV